MWFEIPNCVIAVTNVILFFHIIYLIYKNLRYPDPDIRAQGEFGTGGNDMLRLARGLNNEPIINMLDISTVQEMICWQVSSLLNILQTVDL